jgi:heme oxygenase
LAPGPRLVALGAPQERSACLGTAPSDIAAIQRADLLLPKLDHPAAALGCAWVVEGSALGGRRMARSLRRMPWYEPTPGAFFSGEATQTSHWQACCDAIEDCVADTGRRHEMRVAARAASGAFETFPMGNQ